MFILHISIVTIREIYVALAILWITYFLVIGLSIFLNRKLYRGIAVNTSLFSILPIIIITFTTIAEEYDWWYFLEKNYSYWYDIKELIVLIGGILLSIGFIGLYTNVIKRWRAMPE